jgi:hypothetical protein
MHEIADLSDEKFEPATYKYLKEVYHVRQEGNRWVFSPQAKKALQHIKDLHAEHLDVVRKAGLTEASFSEILNSKPPITASEFSDVMNASEDAAKAKTAVLAQRESTADQASNMAFRLLKAREDYKKSAEKTDKVGGHKSEHSHSSLGVSEALSRAFSEFLISE